MEKIFCREISNLLIAKGKFKNALAAINILPKEEVLAVKKEIIAILLAPEKILIDEARDIIEDLPEPDQAKWLEKITDILITNALFDDARYVTGKSVPLEKKQGRRDVAEELKPDMLVKMYISLGMFKRARKIAKEMGGRKRLFFLSALPFITEIDAEALQASEN